MGKRNDMTSGQFRLAVQHHSYSANSNCKQGGILRITKTVGALYEFMTILYNQNKYAKLCLHYIAFLTVKHYENALPLHTNHFVN